MSSADTEYLDGYHVNLSIREAEFQRYETAIIQSSEHHIKEALALYVPPTLLAIGSVGNILIVVVLYQHNMRLKHSPWHYMVTLAVIHTVVLHMGCGSQWLSRILQKPHLVLFADWLCKVWSFLSNTMRYSCNWLVVLFALDRFLLMWYPLRASYISNGFSAKLLTIAVYIGLGVTCIHSMWTYELIPGTGCTLDPNQRDFETIVWPWISAAVCSYVPLLLNIFFGAALTLGLCWSKCKQTSNEQQNDQYMYTSLMLCISQTVVCLPNIVVNLVIYFRNPEPLETARLYLAWEILAEGHCFYMASTFVIYLLSVPQLRAEVIALCSGSRDIPSDPQTDNQPLNEIEEESDNEPKAGLLLSVTTSGHKAMESTFL